MRPGRSSSPSATDQARDPNELKQDVASRFRNVAGSLVGRVAAIQPAIEVTYVNDAILIEVAQTEVTLLAEPVLLPNDKIDHIDDSIQARIARNGRLV